MQRRIRKVPREDNAAVRHGEKEGLAEIKTGMPSHNQPEIAGAPQAERENQPDHDHAPRAPPPFAGILQVDASKEQRKQYGGWPETDAFGFLPLAARAKPAND